MLWNYSGYPELSQTFQQFTILIYIHFSHLLTFFSFLPRNFMKHPWCRKESRPDSPDSRPALPAPAPALPAPAAAPAHGLLDKAAVAAVEQVPNQNARAEYLGGGYHWSSVDGFCWDFQHVELGSLHFLLKVGSFLGFQILDVDVGMSCANFGYICWPWDELMVLHHLFWDWQWIPAFLKTRKALNTFWGVLDLRLDVRYVSPHRGMSWGGILTAKAEHEEVSRCLASFSRGYKWIKKTRIEDESLKTSKPK